MTSNVGKWDKWNETAGGVYGDTKTAFMAAELLEHCSKVEDWGCGRAGMREIIGPARWIGVDGSPCPVTTIKADLPLYRSDVEGILIRHVLEHNWEWKPILENALRSFRKTLVIILFTPWAEASTINLHDHHPEIDCPDLSFNRDEFVQEIDRGLWKHIEDQKLSLGIPDNFFVHFTEDLKTRTVFGVEHVIAITRKEPGK